MAILIVMINNCVKCNDTEYTPKAFRCKWCAWLRKKTQKLLNAFERKISTVVERLISHKTMTKKKRRNKYKYGIKYLWINLAVVMTSQLSTNAQVSRFDTDLG